MDGAAVSLGSSTGLMLPEYWGSHSDVTSFQGAMGRPKVGEVQNLMFCSLLCCPLPSGPQFPPLSYARGSLTYAGSDILGADKFTIE